MTSLARYLEQKGQEYKGFDFARAPRIFKILQPHLSLKARKIHIIGTNGKGSTGRYLTLLIRQCGYRVLHFTSPHLFDFKERFYKNDALIYKEELQSAHEFLQQFSCMQEASYFEYATFLALVLAEDVDFMIMEAGIGGEFDCTSVLEYELGIFTQIGLDHQEMLGESLEEIARTKFAAMAKYNILAIQPYEEVTKIARDIAQSKKLALQELTTSHLRVYEKLLQATALGFLKYNALSALAAFEKLIGKMPEEMPVLNLQGRMQKITRNILLDVGHNIDAAKALLEVISSTFETKIILIYNSYKDKNIKEILEILKPVILRVEIFPIQSDRIMDVSMLKDTLATLRLDHRDFSQIQLEYNYVVFGSFSVVQGFLKLFNSKRAEWKIN